MNIVCNNPNLYNALSMAVGPGYNQKAGGQVVDAVHEVLIDALGIDAEEIVPNAGLMEKLGGESIDGLDIAMRLEKQLNIKMSHKNILEKEKTKGGAFPEQNTVIDLTKRAYVSVTNKPK